MNITFDKNKYIKDIDEKVNQLLSSEMMSIDPFELEEDSLKRIIENRTKKASFYYTFYDEFLGANNFGTFVTIGNVEENEYMGKVYQTVELFDVYKKSSFSINLNQFRYAMYPVVSGEPNLDKIRTSPSTVVYCSINQVDDVERYFRNNKDKTMFYLYSFPTVNAFNKDKRCYRFVDIENGKFDIEVLKKVILQIQWFVLAQLSKHTTLFTIPTLFFLDGKRIGYPSFSEEVCVFFQEQFEQKYRQLISEKLYEVESRMKEMKILRTDESWML